MVLCRTVEVAWHLRAVCLRLNAGDSGNARYTQVAGPEKRTRCWAEWDGMEVERQDRIARWKSEQR